MVQQYSPTGQVLLVTAYRSDNQAMLKGAKGEALGKRLQQRAREKGLSGPALAKHFGITKSGVYSWFKTGRIGKEHLIPLANLLQWTVRDMLGSPFPIPVSKILSVRAQHLAERFDALSDEEQEAVWPALLKLLEPPPEGNGGEGPPRTSKPGPSKRTAARRPSGH